MVNIEHRELPLETSILKPRARLPCRLHSTPDLCERISLVPFPHPFIVLGKINNLQRLVSYMHHPSAPLHCEGGSNCQYNDVSQERDQGTVTTLDTPYKCHTAASNQPTNTRTYLVSCRDVVGERGHCHKSETGAFTSRCKTHLIPYSMNEGDSDIFHG